MKNYIIELSDGNFIELEKEYKVIKINGTNTAFVYCDNDDVQEIKRLSTFISVTPDNSSTISDFKFGL